MSTRWKDVLDQGADCQALDQTLAALEGASGPDAKAACEKHLAACAHCTAEVALFHSFNALEASSEEREGVSHIVSRLRSNSPAAPVAWWKQLLRPRLLMPAAIAVAAAVIAISVNLNSRPGLFETPPVVYRSTEIVAIAPLGDLVQQPAQFQWKPVDRAVSYRVRLIEVDQTELWTASATSPSIEIPAEVRARITPLKKLLWEVTAIDTDGRSVATSGTQSFRLSR